MSIQLSSLSVQEIKVPVVVAGIPDVTVTTVQMAVSPAGQDPTNWVAAAWDALTPPNAYVLVGPGTSIGTLNKGQLYEAHVKISSSPEAPVLRGQGVITVF